MRGTRLVAVACVLAAALAACSSDKKSTRANTTTTTTASAVSPPTAASSTSTTELFPTTSLPCDTLPTPTAPLTNPAPPTSSVLLTKVDTLGDRCTEHIIFSFTSKEADPPGYTVSYASPPFAAVDSGRAISIRGSAFVGVRLSPAYGYDFENATPTYTGPKRIDPAGAGHVTEIVETGDSEGVVNWVIGLDTKRPFTVQATGKPQTQLVVTIG